MKQRFFVDWDPRLRATLRRGCALAVLLAALPLGGSADDITAPDDILSPTLSLAPNPAPFTIAIGSATSQGVSVLKADQARSIFGVTGAGVKLGVISDSFNGSGSSPTVATQIAAGNLPGAGNPNGYTTGVTVVKDDTGTDEGRAMLEIVHDVAPGAQLYFHSAFNNTAVPSYSNATTATPDQTIADAITGLAGVSGMRVIVDDVGILTAARFQDGAAARAASAAYGNGIAYFSAAGNSATNATRVTTTAGVSGTVNWGTDNLLLMRIGANSSASAVLQWGEPYPSISGSAATSNFIVAATTTNGAATYFTVDNQWAGEDPYEFVTVTNSGTASLDFAFKVIRGSGTAPVTMQLTTYGNMSIIDADKTNAPTISGQAAAVGAVGVAASYWGTPSSVESFSSRGPTLILYDAAGNPINQTRSSPLLTAPDGGTTTTSGFTSFYGTSAAAPHAAAVAALVMERFDQKGLSYSTQDVYQVLYDSAVDIGTAGFDTTSGYGRIDALAAVSAGRIWDGNGSSAGVSGTGSWSQAKWTLEAAGDKPTGKFIRGQQAIFGSGTAAQAAYAITVDGNYDVAGLQFARDTVTLTSGSGSLRLTSPTVDVAAGLTATVAATLTGTGGLQKTGFGALNLTGSAGYTGGTTISAGTLYANGNLTASGPVSVSANATLAGSGTVGAVTLATNATIAPGNSPGTLTTGNVIFGAGGNYNWQMTSATGTAGSQWDFISSSGSLTVNATAGSPFAINLWTLSGTGPDVSGSAANFSSTSNYTWKIGSFAGGITGFASNLFSIVTGSANGTAGFANAFAGTFSIAVIGNDLDILYTAATPSSYDYTGGTGLFSGSGNWAGGSTPAGVATITFSGTGGTATNDLVTAVSGLTFTAAATGGYVVTGTGFGVGSGGVTNASASTQTIQAALSLTASATVAANAGSLALSGGLDNGGYTLTVGGGSSTTISGAITGAGGLVKSGSGTLTLSASNAYAGGTTLTSGTIVAGNASALGGSANALALNAGTLSTGTVSLSIGALSGSAGAVITTGSSAGTRTLTTTVASGSSVFAGSIQNSGSGVMALTKAGGGTLVLSGSNSYTGSTTISAGTLQVGNGGAAGTIGSGSAAITNNGQLLFARSDGYGGAFTRVITGSGGVTLASGSLTLTGSNSYGGGTTIRAGTLLVGGTFALGGTANPLAMNGGTLNLQTFNVAIGALSGSAGAVITTAPTAGTRTLTTTVASGTSIFAGSLQNSGSGVMALTKAGAGTLVLTGSHSNTGLTSITGGALQVGNGGTAGRLASGTIANNGSLVFNRSDAYGGAVSSVITGTGSLTLSGGTLALTATSSFSGPTAINAGTLQVNGAIASSAIAVNAGGQLAGSGAVGSLTVNSGGTLIPGNGLGTLVTGDVILSAGGNYNWQMMSATGTAGSQWDFINSSGSLTVNATTGNPFAINLWTITGTGAGVSGTAANFNQYAGGSWKIGTFAGGITGFDSALFSIVTGSANGTGGFANAFAGTFSIATVGNDLNVVYTAPVLPSYDYTGGTGLFSDATNWSVGAAPTGITQITFSGAGGTATNDLLAAVNSLTFTGSATGGYVVTGSSLAIGAGGVVNDSAFTQTVQSPLTLSATAALTANGGGLAITGAIDNGGFGLTVAGAADTTLGSVTGAGSLTKTGVGRLTLSGSSSFTGGTTINAGTVAAADALALGGSSNALAVNGGTLDTGTVSLAVGALSGSAGGAITTGSDAGTRTLTTTVASGSSNYAGTLQDNGSGLLAFTKAGAGTLALSGSNAFTGGTTLTAGTLQVGSSLALGGSSNALVVNGGTLDTGGFSVAVGALSGSSSGVITTASTAGTRTLTTTVDSGTATYAGRLQDNGPGKLGLTKAGAGTLALSGSNSFTGGATLSAGTLRVGGSLALGGASNALAVNGGTLDTGTFSVSVGPLSGSSGAVITTAPTAGTRSLTTTVPSGTSVFAGSLQNSGSGVIALTKAGAGTLVLSGSNSNTGLTSITGGTLQVGDGGTGGGLGSGAIVNNAALVFNRSDAYGGPLANTISGSGSLTLARGALTLSASTSFSGDTRVASGTLALAHPRALAGSTLDLNAADTGIVALSGTGVQTYVLGGLEGSRSLAIGGNTLSIGGNNQSTTYAGTIAGAGGLVKAGLGTVALTGSNIYAGATTISGGTLQVGAGGTSGALGGGPITNNATLVFNRSDDYGGPLATAITGTGSLRLAAGALTLTGSNGATGATTILGGTLTVGGGGTSGGLGSGAVVNNAGLVFNRSDGYGGPVANTISGTGSLTLARGALTLSGSSSFAGSTTIAGGTLTVGAGGTSGGLGSGPITNNAALVFNRIDGYGGTVANAISGTGSLTVTGGTLALGGANGFTGETRVAGGVLSLVNTQALAGSTLNLYSLDSGVVALSAGTTATTYTLGGLSGSRNLAIGGNTLAVGNNNAATSYSGSISGSGGLIKIGTGTFTMTGSNSYTGPTTVYSGRLVGNTTSLSGTIASSSSWPSAGTAVEFAQATSGTFSGRISGGIEGSLGIVKSGSGTLTLTGSFVNNTAVTVTGGRLVTGAGNLSGSQLVNNATVEFNQATSGTLWGFLTGTGALVKTGSGTLTLQAGSFTGATTVSAGRLVTQAATLRGPITTSGALEFAQSSNGEYASVLSGSGTLAKSGSGTLLLSGTSLVTGMTTVSAGILATGGAERLADTSTVSLSGGASLRLGGNETIGALVGSGSVNLQSYRLTIAGSGSSSYAGSIVGSGGLTKAGMGLLALSGSNGFLGATNLDAGTLLLSSSQSLSPYTTLTIASGATLVLNRDVRVFAYTNAGTISGSGRLLTSSTAATGGTLASLADVSGTAGYAVGLLKTSTETLVVSGSTSFSGGVVVEQGTVKLAPGGSFVATNVVDVRSGATLDLNGQSQTVAALAGSGSVALGGGTLTVDAATNATFAGTLAGGAFVKTGASALNLTGSATVSTAAVTSGLMAVNGVLTGPVAVAPGGTLGGAGTIIGDVSVSGIHAPGNSPDISTIAGNLNYGAGATVIWEIAGNTATQGPIGSRAFDQIVVNGDLTFSGSTSLVLSFYDQDPNTSWTSTVDWTDPFWTSGHTWTLWQVSGTTTGLGNLSLSAASWLDSLGSAFGTALPDGAFSLASAGSNVTLVYSVPEPGTLALAALGAGCLAAGWARRVSISRRSRRRRRTVRRRARGPSPRGGRSRTVS